MVSGRFKIVTYAGAQGIPEAWSFVHTERNGVSMSRSSGWRELAAVIQMKTLMYRKKVEEEDFENEYAELVKCHEKPGINNDLTSTLYTEFFRGVHGEVVVRPLILCQPL